MYCETIIMYLQLKILRGKEIYEVMVNTFHRPLSKIGLLPSKQEILLFNVTKDLKNLFLCQL